jgi:hypothetical protein
LNLLHGGCRVEHHPTNAIYEGKYNLGLTKDHYFINDDTNLTSYCLKHYEDIKHLNGCSYIYNDNHHTKQDRGIKALQLFKILIDNVGKLIVPIPLTEELIYEYSVFR